MTGSIQPDAPLADTLSVPSLDGNALLTLSVAAPAPLLRLYHRRPLSDGNPPAPLPLDSQRCVLTLRLPYVSPHPAPTCAYVQSEKKYDVTFPASDCHLHVTALESSFELRLQSADPDRPVTAEVDMHPAAWYGLGHLMNHHWPLSESSMHLSPVYPFDNGPTGLSTMIDPTFMSSAGALLAVHDHLSPCFHVAVNAPVPHDATLLEPLKWETGIGNLSKAILPVRTPVSAPRTLTLQSRPAFDHTHLAHPWSGHRKPGDRVPQLAFTLSATGNVKHAALASLDALSTTLGPVPLPAAKLHMMQYPIWSTWAQYKREIDQEKVLAYAHDIVRKGLPRSIMGIDDRWSSGYGELRFDPVKFPDPTAMVTELHELGFKVTLWVTPFANIGTAPLCNPDTRRYYVSTQDGEPGAFRWWQADSSAAALNVTDPAACEWFVGELRKLCANHGVDGFKFDAGEPCFLPAGGSLQDELDGPSDYTRGWIHNVASKFDVAEVRSGVRGCQSAAPMFRIFDKYSTWGLDNGLASVLTAVLTSGILGFPFCIPDYIAGNAYQDEIPDAELMIRWTQASVAMSALQFSIPPWFFDDENDSNENNNECGAAVAAALRWRELLFWPHIKNYVTDAADKMWPIVRPMWWEEPELEDAQKLFDQFMVGENLVVAPVVVKAQRERAVFLPRGLWKKVDLSVCQANGEEILGPVWLDDVPAPLDDMPVYVRVA